MLNPSTADADRDDPTVRRCVGFARRWGCVELAVVNLFAFRATRPADLCAVRDPVGVENCRHVESAVRRAKGGFVVFAWGTHGTWRNQDLTVMGWVRGAGVRPLCLGLTKGGHPRHPLYVPYATEPVAFSGAREGVLV
jgi:hypothetical protein